MPGVHRRSSPPPTSDSSPCRRRSTRRSPARCSPATRCATSASRVAAVVAETLAQGVDAAEAVFVDIDFLPAVVDIEVGRHRRDADLRSRRLERRVRHDRARHAREHTGRRRTSPTARSIVTGRFLNQRVAPCPLEVRGSAAAWIDGRLHQWVSTQHAQGVKASRRRRQRGRRRRRADHHARRRWRVRRQDRLVPRGAAARPDRQADRPPGAVARDPQRIDDGARPRPRPGAVRHARRHPRRQGHPLPAPRDPGLRRVRRDRARSWPRS